MKNERLITEKSLFKALNRHCLQAFVMLSIFNFLCGCVPEKDKSQVFVTWKKYCPYESGDGITSENEKYLVTIYLTTLKYNLIGLIISKLHKIFQNNVTKSIIESFN